MNQVVIRNTDFHSKPLCADDDTARQLQLFCEALQSYPKATSQRPSLTFAEYLRDLQELQSVHS